MNSNGGEVVVQFAGIAWEVTHSERVASGQWRKQVQITREGPDVSQSLEKQSHCQLRLMLKSVTQL